MLESDSNFKALTEPELEEDFPSFGLTAQITMDRMIPVREVSLRDMTEADFITSSLTFYLPVPSYADSYNDLPLTDWEDETGLNLIDWELSSIVVGRICNTPK